MSDRHPTKAEMRAWERQRLLAEEDEVDVEEFPRLDTFSPAFLYQFVPVPEGTANPPEYIYVRPPDELGLEGEARSKYQVFLTQWNTLWEAGTERVGVMADDAPDALRWVLNLPADVRLLPRGRRNRYDAYATLYHLLPHRTLREFGLPLLKRGLWPFWTPQGEATWLFPRDFDKRLERAISYHLWPLLGRGVPSAFADDEPIRILSHNLDFWMPFADMVAQARMRGRGRVPIENEKQRQIYDQYCDQMPPGVTLQRPLYGGEVWAGEEEAWEVTEEMVELADGYGRLRGILDAIRSHRLEDDFTDRWSYEREDFERKLYRKRAKVQVRFVELDETTPVHGPESEVHEDLLWEDFFAVLNAKEREVVVCLRSGITKVGEIAEKLGYANHSPVSKKLARVRRKAERFFELN